MPCQLSPAKHPSQEGDLDQSLGAGLGLGEDAAVLAHPLVVEDAELDTGVADQEREEVGVVAQEIVIDGEVAAEAEGVGMAEVVVQIGI